MLLRSDCIHMLNSSCKLPSGVWTVAESSAVAGDASRVETEASCAVRLPSSLVEALVRRDCRVAARKRSRRTLLWASSLTMQLLFVPSKADTGSILLHFLRGEGGRERASQSYPAAAGRAGTHWQNLQVSPSKDVASARTWSGQ